MERHFQGNARLRDIVIGMSDGLTVPFALAAGLSGAIASSHVVVTAGLAEIAAGSIAMGLGGFLAARSDAEHYASERKREQVEMAEKAHLEFAEVKGILEGYGLSAEESEKVTHALQQRPEVMVDFMMRFELGLERPEQGGAWKSALTIGLSYVAGGLIPLLPYFFLQPARRGLPISAAVTLVALAVFGFVKGRFTGARPLQSALQTTGIGSLAAGAAFIIARLVAG
jgi:vacuolar iron transporter family protein